ncbi:hypothetical protein PTSG_04788 [Salpingoeca rosetta]|uniref:Gamma-glutamyltransferase n=1 Tax=Salpingoeca rosetta (strain ATCC 50818 / BSB-021) TaxID=946362 RepID=F2U9P6_SALR5|nr:uncharacterized protein PTSG_04788 [Salpingoeca rosetta]EGD73073.1 hypothetical protein PTSG_04788 [Salpingoeca rosetta]|eukprot:XP_004994104.1 hypothetical protein PTSG_04788 [Salpingoeca rosetta]
MTDSEAKTRGREPLPFQSRRSPVISMRGCAASTQPIASAIGTRILQQGGNAADAAVAMAAALNVTEPCSTGIGGDCFCLYFDATTKKVRGLNGSGRSAAATSLEHVRQLGHTGSKLPADHALCVTVPGAAAGWVDTVEAFGTMSLRQVLQPAIDLAEEGAPIHHITAHAWTGGARKLQRDDNPHGGALLMSNREAPSEGEVMVMKDLANTFKLLAEHGKAGFYEGRVAEAIVDCVQGHGGLLTLEDLKGHMSTFDDPISVTFKGKTVYEMPPNGQGITALLALNILKHVPDLHRLEHNSGPYLHRVIEALRLAFADSMWFVADPATEHVPITQLLSEEYGKARAQLIHPDGPTAPDVKRGNPFASTDTVYFTVVDAQGNACSFINSNYMGFGTGYVPKACGFTLQNRGHNFILQEGHPNCLAPRKRPYHTIIPAMATNIDDGSLYASFGVMGGFMQPQGHVQVLLNMLLFGMDPQRALDVPRFCIGPGHEGVDSDICVEDGVDEEAVSWLSRVGHPVSVTRGYSRALFGRGQIIQQVTRADSTGRARRVFIAGSDPRGDGCALPAV